MKITITKADYEKASEAIKDNSKSILQCCLVYQALVRNGFDVYTVAYTIVRLKNKETLHLAFENKKITFLHVNDWEQAIGDSFEVTP